MLSLLLAAASPSISEAKEAIADHTVNPSAVQFKNIREGNGVVCGEFNAPNKSGGYDGFDVFVYESKDHWMMGLVDGKVMADGSLYDLTYLWDQYQQHRDLNALDKHTVGAKGRSGMIKRCPYMG